VVVGRRLSATRTASHGVSRRSGDSDSKDQDGYGFPSDPLAFRRPSGVRPASHDRGRSRALAPLTLSRPFRDNPLKPRTAASLHQPEGRATRPAMLPLLGFRALRHSLGPADPRTWAADPSATACHVRGLGTPLATYTTGPPGARGAGASMGFSLQGVPLDTRGAPLEVLALLTLPAATPPEGGAAGPVAYRASCPCRVRAAVGLPREPDRRCLPGIPPCRAFSPSVRAIACSHDAGPLALQRDDVPTCLGHRASRSEWIGLSVSGLPALLGFRTFQPSRRSVHRPGEWAHGFTSRRTPRTARYPLRSVLPR
jgi:hypothetical protein